MVKEHDGKDDEEGERINSAEVCGADFRLYAVSPDQQIKVTIKNLSAKPLSFRPVYVDAEGSEEPNDIIEPLKRGEVSVCASAVYGSVSICVRARVHVCVMVTGCGLELEIGVGIRASLSAAEASR